MSAAIEQAQQILRLIFSGSVEGIDNIRSKRDIAIEDSIRLAIPRALQIYGFTVAKDTGAMRAGFRDTGQGQDLEQIIINVEKTNGGYLIRQRDVYNAMIDNEPKLKWHIRQSPDFNPNFSSGYGDPTTPGTSPIDMEEVMRGIYREIQREAPKQLRKQGLDAQ